MEYPEESAREELKRADHLLFVTLKYTRTADVIKNTIKRLINAFDLQILKNLEYAKKKRKIKEISLLPRVRCENLIKIMPDHKTKDFINFYFLLRKIEKLDHTAKNEFRKHVTLISMENNQPIMEVTTDILKDYFNKTAEFIDHMENLMKWQDS